MAFDTMRGNKLRSFLTIVGVVVGVITVMLISSIISGINVAVEKEVEIVWNTIDHFSTKWTSASRTSSPTREERMRKPLTMETPKRSQTSSTVEARFRFWIFQIIFLVKRSCHRQERKNLAVLFSLTERARN